MVVVNAVVLTICVIFAIFLPQIGTIIRLVYVTVFFTLRVTKICDRTSRLRVHLNRSESDQMGSNENPNIIRMHSSRMRTSHLLPVSPSMHCAEGGSGRWGGCLLVVWGWWGFIPACNRADPPTPLWTEFLTHASENITLPQLHCGR